MKTVIVTGGNRGIGLEICRQLDALGWQVILCSRDRNKGLKASQNLSKNVIVKQLDVTNEESISNLFNEINKEFGKLDVLINNAGLGANASENNLNQTIRKNISPQVFHILKKVKSILVKTKIVKGKSVSNNSSFSKSKEIMETNFYGPWRMMSSFIPLLQNSNCGKIINISSGMGALNNLTGMYPEYSLSKASLNALTVLYSNELQNKNIQVNAMCPGWVKTDMGGPDAPRTVEEGAETAIWLTTTNERQTGKFFKDKQIINW